MEGRRRNDDVFMTDELAAFAAEWELLDEAFLEIDGVLRGYGGPDDWMTLPQHASRSKVKGLLVEEIA